MDWTDYLAAVTQGLAGTTDPTAAGLAPGVSAAPAYTPPSPPAPQMAPGDTTRVLARLSQPQPIRPFGDNGPSTQDLGVGAVPTGPYADLQAYAAGLNQGNGANAPQPSPVGAQTAPPPVPMPSPVPMPVAPPQPSAPPIPVAALPAQSGIDASSLLAPILADMQARQKGAFWDNLTRFGLATMAAGGKPGATTLGAIGQGGLSAMDAANANRALDLKALLTGAQASNLLSETGLRSSQIAARQANLNATVNDLRGGAPAPGGGAVTSPGSGASIPSGALGPNMTKIASTLAALGHSPAQIAGALGWATAESGGQDTNTRAVNDTGADGKAGGAYGWQQWLADRRTALNQFAKDNDARPDDPVIQAKFFDHEMRTGDGAGTTAQNAYWSAQTPDQAVVAMAHYGRGQGYTPENPQGTRGFSGRLAAAQQIYGALTGGAGAEGEAGAAGAPGANGPSGAVGGASGGAVNPAYARYRAALATNAGDTAGAGYWYGVAKAPENFTWDGNGNAVPIRGGPADTNYVAAKTAAQEDQKINISRSGAITRGGQYIGHVPLETTVVDAQGNKYPAFTPPMGSAAGNSGMPSGVAMAPPTPGAAATGANPVTGAAAPPGAVMGAPSALGPGQTEALKTRAEEEQKQRQEVIDQANAAQQAQAPLQNMRNEAPNITAQGPFAPHAQEAAQWLRYVLPSFNQPVASYEDFTKNAGMVLRTVTREVSSREAVQGMQMFERALPSTEQSPQGFDRVSGQFMGMNDFRIVKAQAQQDWEQQHGGTGNVSDFETTFQKQLTPLPFMFMRLSAPDQAELSQRLGQTKDGQALRAKLAAQLGYIKANGYDQAIQ
jgi:hypothetical protein